MATVGGRRFDLTKPEIERRMRGVQPEPIREHLVEVLDTVYPPKQVLAVATGWGRTSFTTMEAQRVLSGVGFVCRRADSACDGQRVWSADEGFAEGTEKVGEPDSQEARMARMEAQLAVMQEAVASLAGRVQKLELGVH